MKEKIVLQQGQVGRTHNDNRILLKNCYRHRWPLSPPSRIPQQWPVRKTHNNNINLLKTSSSLPTSLQTATDDKSVSKAKTITFCLAKNLCRCLLRVDCNKDKFAGQTTTTTAHVEKTSFSPSPTSFPSSHIYPNNDQSEGHATTSWKHGHHCTPPSPPHVADNNDKSVRNNNNINS